MKKYILILIPLLILFTSINANASRIKQDLLSSKENEIVILLKEKIAIIDKLIIEAKIYQTEKDPLIQRDFFDSPNAFITKTDKRQQSIQTNTWNPIIVKKKRTGYLGISSSNKIGGQRFMSDNLAYKRDILGIKMNRKSSTQIRYNININFLYLLVDEAKINIKRLTNRRYKQKINDNLETIYKKEFKLLINELSKKYFNLISLLSNNKLNKTFIPKYTQNWDISSKIFFFNLHLDYDNFIQKKTYDLSAILDETFKELRSKETIDLAKVPTYYKKIVDEKLRCLETAKNIKYKGRICINPIDINKDIYFNYGVFETKENNFLYQNKTYFDTLIYLDKQLKKSSQEYIQFLILKASSSTKKTQINLEGGL